MTKTDREKKIDELTDLLDKRGYLTKEERKLYRKLIDEKIKEKSMSDEEQLALLKDQTSNGFGQLGKNGIGFAASNEAGQLAGDCIGFNTNGERPASKFLSEEITELEERIAKKNATNR